MDSNAMISPSDRAELIIRLALIDNAEADFFPVDWLMDQLHNDEQRESLYRIMHELGWRLDCREYKGRLTGGYVLRDGRQEDDFSCLSLPEMPF